MRSYICDGDKYAYGKGYVYLPVKLKDGLPKEIGIENTKLSLKSSFHVSLICMKNILNKNPLEGLEGKILKSFCNLVSKNDSSPIRFIDEFRFAEFEERKTVIVRCLVPGLDMISSQLSSELDIDIPLQPTHITLYTLQPDLGIGLNSFPELEDKSKIIKAPDEVRDNLALS